VARLRSPIVLAAFRLALLLPVAGCTGWYQYALPVSTSPAAAARANTLLAGSGRSDLTPPPGVGLAGNGPEGRTATGWRHRLYARALVLEDRRGERIALVVTDLAHVSANLHRLAAARVVSETGIGADRLIVSATHTHSGPGHFYGERQYNEHSARLAGYDPAVTEFLVSGIVNAVRQAYRDLKPAKAAWGFQVLRGFTRNRSYRAYCHNPPHLRGPCPKDVHGPEREEPTLAVDSIWALLRVDRVQGDSLRPFAAFSVFAIHGTANPSTATVVDGDIHAVVERRLEQLIDAENGDPPGFVPRAVHLFANGNEGDVSPNRDLGSTQCPVPRLLVPGQSGPREPGAPWEWIYADSSVLRSCLAAARAFIQDAGTRMGDSAFAHFQRLGKELRGDIQITRAFTTIRLPGYEGLCPRPAAGTATAAGAADVPTRMAGWRLLGFIPVGFEQGNSAKKKQPKGCHSNKRILLGSIQDLVTGEYGLPDAAQLAVVRIGNVLLGAVPFEPTITSGRLFREAMTKAADPTGQQGLRSVIVGLANGFVQYVATPYEYAEQGYEGGSTLYGPRTQAVLEAELERLGAALARSFPSSPPADVAPMLAYPGKPEEIMPRATAANPLTRAPALLERRCSDDGMLEVTWLDQPPGRLNPSDGQVLQIEALQEGNWTRFAWDDQADVVVEAVGRRKNEGHEWKVTLSRSTAGKTLQLRILPRRGGQFPGALSAPFSGCPATSTNGKG
jgi:neutral ceramidase